MKQSTKAVFEEAGGVFCPLRDGRNGAADCIGKECAYFGEYVCMRVCVSPAVGKLCPMPYHGGCNGNCGFNKRGGKD